MSTNDNNIKRGTFRGTLPRAGSQNPAARQRVGGQIVYDNRVQRELTLAYAMPNKVGASVWNEDPVGYVRAAGLNPVGPDDEAAFQAFPELALRALAESVNARATMNSTGSAYMPSVVAHVSLGDNGKPGAKARFHVRKN